MITCYLTYLVAGIFVCLKLSLTIIPLPLRYIYYYVTTIELKIPLTQSHNFRNRDNYFEVRIPSDYQCQN